MVNIKICGMQCMQDIQYVNEVKAAYAGFVFAAGKHQISIRIADYDYERHFGGVIYLFLRGVDKEHPQQGIYATRPNAGLIDLMDEMFAGMTLEEA